MSQTNGNQPSSPDEIGSVATRTDIPLAPMPAQSAPSPGGAPPPGTDDAGDGTKFPVYMSTRAEARDMVRAGPCPVCHSDLYWRVTSSDGVELLQSISCRNLFLIG